MNLDENKRPLHIPEQSSDRNDYIQGIGPKEVAIILAALLVSTVVTIFVCVFTNNIPMGLFIGFFMIGSTIIAVKRDAINESMIDKVHLMNEYSKSQKRYEYRYEDVFETEKEGDEE